MTFPIVCPVPRTSISGCTACPACFLAQTGSASIAIGLSTGGFPSKVIVPVTVEAAVATPGENNTATSPAANHTLVPFFPVPDPPMRGSLVIANPPVGAGIRSLRKLYTKLAMRGNGDASARVRFQAFSNASDSASLGSRIGTSA